MFVAMPILLSIGQPYFPFHLTKPVWGMPLDAAHFASVDLFIIDTCVSMVSEVIRSWTEKSLRLETIEIDST